ncbi:MAG: acetyl-CoA carboxylase biotin carboxyl carrier protein [Myxococcaceae bacterium]|nr:acetyl-CoA carboxylase biotin carboxyl carrier protein [Myxococcaceae bacterium]
MAEKRVTKAKPSPAVDTQGSTLDVETLRQVVDILESSEVTRLVWRKGREKLYIRRGALVPAVFPVAAAPGPAAVQVVPPLSAPRPSMGPRVVPSAAAPAPAPAGTPEKKGHLITSPFVGTFYRSPAPDQPVYVEVGSQVKKGQVICIIEAMKLMNEIESEVSGRVAEVLAQNAQPVEFGQPLYRIEP